MILIVFDCIYALCPSEQFFSHTQNQYYGSWQHIASCESQTSDPLISSLALYPVKQKCSV